MWAPWAAKVVLVGDHRQLPELEAGGAFRGLVHRGLAIQLSENHRQVHAWERVALDHLRDGRPDRALALYEAHDRIVVEAGPDRARDRLAEDWWKAGDLERAVMIAQRRSDVEDLNARARERMRAAGGLGKRELWLPGGRFAAGDHVVVKRNDPQRGILNGDRARVIAVDPELRSLTLDCHGERVTLDADFLDARTDHGDPTLKHGYAITAHVAQGVTVDRAFVLAGDGLNRETAYVALSRGRHSNHLYLAHDHDQSRAEFAPADPHPRDPLARLTTALRASSAQSLAIDQDGTRREPGLADRFADAEGSHRQAVARRHALEAARGRWLPGRRRRLAQLRKTETIAASRVDDLHRRRLELAHGARPFITERDVEASFAKTADLIAERRLAREHVRDLGRGLGL